MSFSCPLHGWHSNYQSCPNCVRVYDYSTTELIINPLSIKEDCEMQYAKIKEAEERLKTLRLLCTHENTFEGNYSWRVGNIQVAEMCSDCGELIKYLK